jgi:predicted dehydrogenase
MLMNAGTRREFLRDTMGKTALALGLFSTSTAGSALPAPYKTGKQEKPARTIRFAAIGLNHGHIYGQTDTMLRAGGELVAVFAKEPALVSEFLKRYPQAKIAHSEEAILNDSGIQLVVSASIPDERAGLAIRAMRHGKDFMSDKPGVVSLKQLEEVKRVQAETKRIYSIFYSERLDNRATVRAGELVHGGLIGKVVQTIGLGPHRLIAGTRPEWFFDRERYGGILCDIGSHQFDQFLFFTGSTQARVLAAQARNTSHAQYPGLQDFGDVMLSGDGGSGYIRVDWFTPEGLSTWGDGRLTILGTDGYIEIRKYVDIAGREGGDHLFLVDNKGTRYVDCKEQELPYGRQLLHDILDRTETAMPQRHVFYAMELALEAQHVAQ